MSKRLGRIIGGKDENLFMAFLRVPPMVVTLGQRYHVGEKPTITLYTYINRHMQGDTEQNKDYRHG